MSVRRSVLTLPRLAASMLPPLLFAPLPASGMVAVLGHAPFSYPAGPLGTNNGGTGWAAAWASGSSVQVVATSLAHPGGGLPTAGGATELNAPPFHIPAFLSRDLSGSLGGVTETIWASFLLRPQETSDPDFSYLGLVFGPGGTGNTDQLFVGYSGTNFKLNNWGGGGTSIDVPGVLAGQAVFLVLQLDILAAGNETAVLYLNPTAGLAAPDVAASAPKSDLDLGTFATVSIGGGRDGASNPARLDEVRVGNSYAEVAPALSSISGRVFEDADFAGTASAYDGGTNDALVDSVDVELYDADNADAFVASTVTGRTAAGAFAFSGLADGNYKVRVRTATMGLVDSPPAGGLHPSVPATWPYPLPEMTWGDGAALYGGQSTTTDDTNTGDDAGPGDTYLAVSVSGSDVTGVDFGFAYNLVVRTADDGLADASRSDQGSLRQLLKNANAIVGRQSSRFRIPTSDPGYTASPLAYTVPVAAALPALADTVTLDASTQPDFAGTPIVGLDGNAAGGSVDGLVVASGGDASTVRGLILKRFSRYGMAIQAGADDVVVAGNWIGVDAGGATSMGNGNSGIDVRGANVTIGGTNGLDRNVITNNGNEGINVTGGSSTGVTIRGNFIGLDPDGTNGGGNIDVGIALLTGASGATIGGTAPGAGNVISMNFEGIEVNTSNNVIQGNYFGTDSTGVLDRGQRSDDAVEIQNGGSNNLIGGAAPGAGNVIAFSQLHGVAVKAGTGNAILGNRIHSNDLLGVDLGNDGVTANDGDGDPGANELLNFPEISAATEVAGTVTVDFDLDLGAPLAGSYRIEFFTNPSGPDLTGYGEGEAFADSVTISHTGTGLESFSHSFAGATGDVITATSTEDLGGGNFGSTSEFSQAFTVTAGALRIVKRAFLADGTPVTSTSTVPRGTELRFLLYVNNDTPGAVTDLSIRDVLDPALVYQAGTIKFDNSVPNCAAGNCTGVEEAAIFASVDALTAGTDTPDGDAVSYSGGTFTIDAGDQNVANLQLDAAANRVLSILFTVTMQ